ncbi:hypothetical protein Pmani_017997 [Petrolisthes manimaculis]|uniref:Uncharacterized protein n=1 Tax=Petrolisthes manimaculis TaxID=1843537 RepID=A0AAE1PNV9_9EUCA|nr:hypothetical protein Pmani_017997 [Petrolisthes manimaculis]
MPGTASLPGASSRQPSAPVKVRRVYYSLYSLYLLHNYIHLHTYITGDENNLSQIAKMLRRTCVMWMLLLTHVVMLPLCGLELYLVASNFNVTEGPPPTLPPTLPPSPSTTPSSMIYSRRQDSKDTQGEREFRHYLGYILDSDSYTRLNNDARLYVFLPSAVSAITSLSILMASCCIDIFTTTVSLYTSFALGVLTLTCTLISQSHVNVEDEDFFQMTVWMMASFIALLLLLSLQTVLTIWELRHQSAAWPIINWMNFFTWNTAFLVARMALGVYVIISLCESPFTRGIYTKCTNDWNDWSCPHVRYPIWLSLPVMGTATYSLLVTFEAFFSYYLGISHRPWTIITLVESGLGYILITILGSSFFLRVLLPHSNPYYHAGIEDITIISMITGIVTFIHLLANLFIPNMLQKPFSVKNDLVSVIQALNEVRDKVKSSRNCINNYVSGLMSLALIFMMLTNWWGHLEDHWGMVVLFAVNISILCRAIPSVVLYITVSEDMFLSFKGRAARTGIEGLLAFIGFLGSVCSSAPDSTKPIVAGVIMMVFTIIQILILANEHSLLKKQSEVPPSDDQQKILNEKSEVEIDQNTSNTDIQRDDVVLVA